MCTSRERSCPCNQRPHPHILRSGFAQRLNEKCSPKNLQTRTNSNLQLLTVLPWRGGGGPPQVGSVNQARMLTLARRVARTLSSQSRRSFPLRLTLVMPRTQPLQVRRSMVITWCDVVTLGTSCRAARAVMQQRFTPATGASADEGSALIPIGREPRRPVARLPRHGHSSCSYALRLV